MRLSYVVKKLKGGVVVDNFYKIVPQKKGHYRIASKEAIFMDLFVGKEKALLLDTGYGYGNLRKQVRNITDLDLIIINSHGHLDHTCGNFQFKEKIYIHEKDMELCKHHTNVEHRRRAVECAKQSIDDGETIKENILPKEFDEKAYINSGSGNLVPVKEGKQFQLGGITLNVYEFPGHTSGSIGLFWEEEKILFVGDAINPCLWLFLPEALTLADYKMTLQKTYAIDFTHFYMSHSLEKTEKKVILEYMDAAEHLDYEKGIPCETPLAPGILARMCPREGFSLHDNGKPGFACIVISEEHL